VELHWQAKIRGPDFAPQTFQLRTVTHQQLKDSKGRLIPTVVASHLTETAQQEIAKAVRSHQDQLLALLAEDKKNCRLSHTELAKKLGWKMGSGAPYKVRVTRTIDALKKAKVITVNSRGEITITAAGKEALKKEGGDGE
jgi:hypothetical protein